MELTKKLIADLQSFDTPTVCNALELVVPERRGYGFTTEPLVCTRPELPPMVGIARTASIRAAHPSNLTDADAKELTHAYYAYVDAGPKPSVIVIQDLDGTQRACGAFWGEVNSTIHQGLGALGVITDGSVRDIPDAAEGFQFMADRIGPSHVYAHVVDYGRPVTVAGMRVSDGDLIHADQHGAVVIPPEAAEKVKEAAELIIRKEKVILTAAREPGFNFDRLKQAWGDAAEIH